MDTETIICPKCGSMVPASAYFCPQCGKPLKAKPISTSFSKQVLVYLVSFFLPPFGLTYTWQYYKQGDEKSKEIALFSLILTIVSVILTLWAANSIMSSLTQSLGLGGGLGNLNGL